MTTGPETEPETIRRDLWTFWAERLGDEEAATDILDVVRPGFDLTEARHRSEATGHCRFGGAAMLEPGTTWPRCGGDVPLSLLAVLDTDALPASWLDGLLPPETGLLNFFYLDTHSEQRDPAAFDLLLTHGHTSSAVGRVIPARSALAVETEAPARASVFEPVLWTATPGFSLPPWEEQCWHDVDLGEGDFMPGYTIHQEHFGAWARQAGALSCDDHAFGWPEVEGNGPLLPQDAAPDRYRHILQLSGSADWRMGGDGGQMHWSIPTEALHTGDFSEAVPTPALS